MRNLLVCFAIVWLLVSVSACHKKDQGADPSLTADSLGIGWQKITINGTTNLLDITFVNNSVGFLTGGMEGNKSFIGKSTDGGLTWTRLPISDSIPGAFALFFFDDNYGWLLGVNRILRTWDGGQTWKQITLAVTPGDVQFLSASTGYMSHSGGFSKSVDSGKTWTPLRQGQAAGVGLFFFDLNKGWYTDHNSTVYKTTDAGASFPFLRHLGTQGVYYNVQFTDEQHGFVSGTQGPFRSVDGGNVWTKALSETGMSDVEFLDKNTGYLMVNGEIYKTTDGGNTVTRVAKISQQLIEIKFTDSDHGWAVGFDGAYYRYLEP